MEIRFDKDADYDVYKRDYYPLLVRQGFSWRMFPRWTLYLDMKYPGWVDGINTDKEHTSPNLFAIYSKMITPQEWTAIGGNIAEYKRIVQDGKPSSLPHEILHVMQIETWGPEGSPIWVRACELSGTPLDFRPRTEGGYYYKPAWEGPANYFERIIEGRHKDDAFMDFIRGLYGIRYRSYTDTDYIIAKDKYGLDRAHVPIRLIMETFQDGILRDIDWLEATREVVVISAESGFSPDDIPGIRKGVVDERR